MNAAILHENQPFRVSVITRLIAALCYAIPAIGGALSSFLLTKMFQMLSLAESAGLSIVMAGMKEASLPAIGSLYLAAVCGVVVIIVLVVRMVVQTKTASPPFWFFAIGGILCLVPAALFWKAQLLIIEALSGSSGGPGLGGLGSDVSQLQMMSLIAAPIVIILLAILSVVPLRSRSKRKSGPLITATAINILYVAIAIAIPFLIDGPKRKNEIVNLPTNTKYADEDSDIDKEASMVLTLTADSKLHERQSSDINGKATSAEVVITNLELPGRLEHSMEDKSPDKRIVYLRCDVSASIDSVLPILDIIRKADIDKVGLVVVGEKTEADVYRTAPRMFEVRLPATLDETHAVSVKPNPLTLVAMLDKEGRLKLNNEDMGTISNSEKLENLLTRVFRERENNGVFREGTNEIEKTVFLKVSRSGKYGDFIKLVQAVKVTGASPIGIQIDDLDQ